MITKEQAFELSISLDNESIKYQLKLIESMIIESAKKGEVSFNIPLKKDHKTVISYHLKQLGYTIIDYPIAPNGKCWIDISWA